MRLLAALGRWLISLDPLYRLEQCGICGDVGNRGFTVRSCIRHIHL